MKDKIKRIVLLISCISMMALLIGCGKKEDTELSSKNSATRIFDDFTMIMFNKYERTSRPEFYGYDVYATKDEKSVVVIWTDGATCTIPGYANSWKKILEEAGFGKANDIKEQEVTLNDIPFYSLQWTGEYNGASCCMDTLYTIKEGKMFMIWMIGEPDNAENIHHDLEAMAETLKYTGPRRLPVASDYPFTYTYDSMKITMQEGMYSPGINEMHTGQTSYTSQSGFVTVQLYGLEDHEASIITKFRIEKNPDDIILEKGLEEQVKDYYDCKKDDSMFSDVNMDQCFFEDVWPAANENLKGIILFRVGLTYDDGVVLDNIYFEYNDAVYKIVLEYVDYMPETKEGVYNVVNGLEIL